MKENTMVQKSEAKLAIETQSVKKSFGRIKALDGLDLAVPEGAVCLLVGPNGAGKTTTLRMLLGQVRPTDGSANVFGLDVSRAGAAIRANVGYVPEDGAPIYSWMRVRDLLAYHSQYYERWDDDYAIRLTAAFELRTSVPFGKLSKGEKRRVQLVMAMAHRPALLLLDEPTDGLDPVIRDRFFRLLAAHLADTPTTVLISSHLVYESELLADHLGVMTRGKLSAQLDRAAIDRYLRRYIAEIPRAANKLGDLDSSIIAKRESGKEIDWVVWGEEDFVTKALWNAGSKTRSIKPLSLEEVARLLMEREEVTQ